ncbi:potassium channel family protein [Actinomycetospora atypica]|uniref:Potassium channel family protein n=1 Tax=Actinomycetospora atypica TaxID=1290095 RepID=A0ABV9YLJ2_9PSEU
MGATLTRALADAVLIVVLYYLLPLTTTVDLGTLVTLVLGLVTLTALVGWQIRAIARSPYPTLRAVETLAVVVPAFLVLFAATYTLLAQAHPAAFTQPISRTDALYFTVTVFATVGFGDISATSTAARAVVTLQMVADLLLLGIVLRAILDAVQRGHGRLAAQQRK